MSALARSRLLSPRLWASLFLSAAVLALAALTTPGLVVATTPTPPPGPSITELSPAHGPAAGGNTVVLTGTLMNLTATVRFGSVDAPIEARSATSVTVKAPPGLSGTSVAVRAASSYYTSSGPPKTYTYDGRTRGALKAIPDHGTPAGGNEVTITGEGIDFAGAREVNFGAAAGAIVRTTPTSVVVRPPAGTPKSAVQLTVVTADGNFEGQLGDVYHYDFSTDPPVITGLSPNSSASVDEPTVTLTGTAIEGATEVTVDGVPVSYFWVSSVDGVPALSFPMPDHAPGKVDIAVITPVGTSANTAADDFTYLPIPGQPVITSVSPNRAASSSRSVITVKGRNFTSAYRAGFAGWGNVVVEVVSDTELRFTLWTGLPAATYDLTVYADGGASATPSGDPSNDFTVTADPPQPLTVTPDRGPVAGGNTIVISDDLGRVRFEDVAHAEFNSPAGAVWGDIVARAPTSVTVRVPAGTPGTVTIRLYNTSFDVLNQDEARYTWDAILEPQPLLVSPDHGPLAGGNTVVLSGDGVDFGQVASASFGTPGVGGRAAEIVSRTASSITLIAPAGYRQGTHIFLYSASGTQLNLDGDAYRWDSPTPVVTSISPSSGPVAGGTTITIKGAHFDTAALVTFGPGALPGLGLVVVSDNELRVTTPPSLAPGKVDVTVYVVGATSSPSDGPADDFAYISPAPLPTVTSVSPRSGLAGVGGLTAISGTNLKNVKSIKFGTRSTRTFFVIGGKIYVVAPPLPKGSYFVTVTTAAGTSAVSATARYTYVGF